MLNFYKHVKICDLDILDYFFRLFFEWQNETMVANSTCGQ